MSKPICDYCDSTYGVLWDAAECRDLCVECRFNLSLIRPTPDEVRKWNQRVPE